MGKIRIQTIGDEEQEKKDKQKRDQKKLNKKLSDDKLIQSEKPTEDAQESVTSEPVSEEKAQVNSKDLKTDDQTVVPTSEKSETKPKAKKKQFKKNNKAFHSKKYEELATHLDKSKIYTIKEALDLLNMLQRGKFDETVELHINTNKPGVSGSVTLPNGTGKKTRVTLADDKLIADVEKGIINFDVLVAEPQMMPKLAKVARVLGPRGLMPNPKNGTVTSTPADIVKKYEAGQINFKTEKAPIIHLIVGKVSFGEGKLVENIETIVNAVKKSNISSVTLKSTMSPGIKIKV